MSLSRASRDQRGKTFVGASNKTTNIWDHGEGVGSTWFKQNGTHGVYIKRDKWFDQVYIYKIQSHSILYYCAISTSIEAPYIDFVIYLVVLIVLVPFNFNDSF